jgi:hypothetical protein
VIALLGFAVAQPNLPVLRVGPFVIPDAAERRSGIHFDHGFQSKCKWIPAFAGMTAPQGEFVLESRRVESA